ncbi:MAG: pyridoxamine 5'-phosphate oxidase family protein [Synergistaceae bacterium]|jgi:general stress protein 26|nr:pyridoxamine 5'-phosphate oxidase family protein [Synergistaceae bacterium]
MKEHEISREDAMAKALKLLSGTKTVFLATNGSHGHPNLRAMAPLGSEGTHTLWFSTSSESSKVNELAHDDKAVVYGYSPRNMSEFRLWGSVEVLDDTDSREYIWTEALKEHFPGGASDPNLRVLRFSAVSGMYTAKDGQNGVFEA